jgi:hypothetical protein
MITHEELIEAGYTYDDSSPFATKSYSKKTGNNYLELCFSVDKPNRFFYCIGKLRDFTLYLHRHDIPLEELESIAKYLCTRI